MKEGNKNKDKINNSETVEAVTHTHTHTHTHGIFNKTKNVEASIEGAQLEHTNKIMLKRKIIIILIIIAIILLTCITLLNKNNNDKITLKALAEEEQKIINLDVEIKEETEDIYKCLLTFTSTDEKEKIKSIEYPTEEGKKPQIITVASEDGKEKIGIDYELKKDKVDKEFDIITTKGKKYTESTGYTITYNDNIGNIFKEETLLKGSVTQISITNLAPTQEGKHFIGWSEDKNEEEPDYFENGLYTKLNKDTTFYALWTDQKNGYKENIENESLIGKVSKINSSGEQNITVNGVNYTANVIVENNDLVLDGEKQVQGATLVNKVYEFGNKETDVAKENGEGIVEDAQNMVILKVNGNLTINPNVILTACKSENGYGGPKGLFIYCTGTLSNNGQIDMTARGARAQGQDVYLWQNANRNYEYVPAEGAEGGEGITLNRMNNKQGNNGIEATNRQAGGGGSGSCSIWWSKNGEDTVAATSGSGAKGSSYSGGSGGGGAAKRAWYEARVITESGENNGGKGGDSASVGSSSYTSTRRHRKSRRKWNERLIRS